MRNEHEMFVCHTNISSIYYQMPFLIAFIVLQEQLLDSHVVDRSAYEPRRIVFPSNKPRGSQDEQLKEMETAEDLLGIDDDIDKTFELDDSNLPKNVLNFFFVETFWKS